MAHGYLRDLLPNDLYFESDHLSELINALCKQTKALNPVNGRRHSISVAGFDTLDQIAAPLSPDLHEIHIVPAIAGGKGGLLRIIIGTVLIVGSLVMGNPIAAIEAGKFTFASFAFMTGITLTLGGLLQLVSPSPTLDMEDNGEGSKYLGAPGNTVKLGTRIPLAYGRNRLYGHFVSFNISTIETDPVYRDISDWTPFRE